MFNFEDASTFGDDGIRIEGGTWFTSGASSPVGLFSPLQPTHYFRTNGEIWYHTGTGGSWQQIQAGSASSFDENLILSNDEDDTLFDDDGNILVGGLNGEA